MNDNPNKKECSTQVESILAYLKTGKTITPLEALNLCGCMRLQARIFDIKQRGYAIAKSMVQLPNGKRVMSYWLDVRSLVGV